MPSAPALPADALRRWRGPSPQKTDLTRREIVDAALAEFLEVGIAKTSMDKIAKRAKLAKGTLYLHFPSKEALLQGALEATVLHSALSLLTVKRDPQESMRDYLLRLVLPSMESFHSSGRAQLARLVLAESRSYPALADFYRERVFAPWHRHFKGLFEQAAKEGSLTSMSPAAASALLGAPFWWVLAQESIVPAPDFMVHSPAELTRAQIHAIFGGPSPPAKAVATRPARRKKTAPLPDEHPGSAAPLPAKRSAALATRS